MRVDRRHLIAALAAGLALGPSLAEAATDTADMPPPDDDPPPLIREDYAVARKRFSTRIVQAGPSPDKPQTLAPPHGVRRVSYDSGDLKLVAWLSGNLDAAKPRPAVLVLHGGNALWHGHWDQLALPYVKAGYVAMVPALRGENGLPGNFSGFYDEAGDVVAAATALRAMPGVDPERLFIAGHSVGGTLTMLAAMSAPIFRAAAAYAGNPDARRFFRRYPEDIRFDAANPHEFDMRSAACFATSLKCPILMIHGAREMGADQATRLTVQRAREAGLPVTYSIVGGDHMTAIPGETASAIAFFAES